MAHRDLPRAVPFSGANRYGISQIAMRAWEGSKPLSGELVSIAAGRGERSCTVWAPASVSMEEAARH
jgi:hypothetical protein